MNRCHPNAPCRGCRRSGGFSLIELLVVITIIGILAGLSLAGIRIVMIKANDTAIRMEIEAIEGAANNYATEYGDLPPDGSSWVVMNRHLNKAHQRISAVDRTLLYNMCHDPNVAASNTPSGSTFYPVAIDRAECIVLFLGGLSADEQRPFTGPGGPFQFVGTGTDSAVDPDNYQYNIDRNSPRMDFDVTRLTLSQLPDPTAPVSKTNRVLSSDDSDLIPWYLPNRRTAPLIYFDSRTYGYIVDTPMDSATTPYNGFAEGGFGAIRPYKTNLNPPGAPSGGATYTAATVPEALRWHNADTFQLISAGQDDHFGNLANNPSDATMPAYFITETGQVLACNTSATSATGMLGEISGFQERQMDSTVENTHLDNITNFNENLRMEDNLSE